MLKGIGVSSGIVIGKAYVLEGDNVKVLKYTIADSQVDSEIHRFHNALTESKNQIIEIKRRAIDNVSEDHLFILDTHLMILKDDLFVNDTIGAIKEEKLPAECALKKNLDRFVKLFDKVGDDYFRGKKTDIENIFNRVLNNLLGHCAVPMSSMTEPVILVANDVSPSDAVQMDKSKIIGFATNFGGKTSHTSILAATMGIPAVVGLKIITDKISTGDPVIVDGIGGTVIVKPTNEEFKRYLKKQQRYKYYEKELFKFKDTTAEIKNGYRVNVMANISHSDEISTALKYGADGVGLFRTEYLFMNKKRLPKEEEMFLEYKTAIKRISPLSCIIRTIDLGGEKLASSIKIHSKTNPALGIRAIRLCLKQVKIFKSQLRGILRASHYGKIKLMFPMISCFEELIKAKTILEEVKEDLRKKGIPFNEKIPIGVMIEIPSAAIISDIIAKEVDFFSIGTNDLIQYTVAVDRGEEELSCLYQPFHPAILRLLKTIIESANNENIEVGICGEMGNDPSSIIILMGLGMVNQLSMDVHTIPKIKRWLQIFTIKEAQHVAQNALTLPSANAVNRFVNTYVKEKYSKELSFYTG